MKDCVKYEQDPSACDGDCANCGIDFPSAEEMLSNDKNEDRKNMFFLIAVAVCMIVFVILCGTILNHVTGGKVTEKKDVGQIQIETEYEA